MSRFILESCGTCFAAARNEVPEGLRVDRTDDWNIVLPSLQVRFDLGNKATGLLIAGENQGHVTRLNGLGAYALSTRTEDLYSRAAQSLVREVMNPEEWGGDYDVILHGGNKQNPLSQHYYEIIIPKL